MAAGRTGTCGRERDGQPAIDVVRTRPTSPASTSVGVPWRRAVGGGQGLGGQEQGAGVRADLDVVPGGGAGEHVRGQEQGLGLARVGGGTFRRRGPGERARRGAQLDHPAGTCSPPASGSACAWRTGEAGEGLCEAVQMVQDGREVIGEVGADAAHQGQQVEQRLLDLLMDGLRPR